MENPKIKISYDAKVAARSIIRGHEKRLKEYQEWEESIMRPGNPAAEMNVKYIDMVTKQITAEKEGVILPHSGKISDPTYNSFMCIEEERIRNKYIAMQWFYIQSVQIAINNIDPGLKDIILSSTIGIYNKFKRRFEPIPFSTMKVPCSINTFYSIRRRFIYEVAHNLQIK